MRKTTTALFCLGMLTSVWAGQQSERASIGLENIQIKGDLEKRIHRNFDRLESERFQPIVDKGCLRVPQYSWPGDMEGRTILSLAMLQQAGERDAKYLPKTMEVVPGRMNELGYFGKNYFPKCDEQQLSGHGWLLRGLCELYLDRKDPSVKKMIENIVDNLVVPTQGKHKVYPIDPTTRAKGKGSYSGEVAGVEGVWRLSTDVGCDFIFMDGVIQAADVLNRKDIYPIIDEMVARFLEVDLVAIEAQTHATLTALRGLVRYAEMTDNPELIAETEKRFDLYVREGSTENHANYNWFGRPTHTEPCAFIDGFMVGYQLWQATGNTRYLEEAHRIYFNGMGHGQRANGGFGCDKCLGSKDANLYLSNPEAWWCCSMRGSEGLVKAAEYSFVQSGNTLMLPFFNDATVAFKGGMLNISTAYPYDGSVTVKVEKAPESGTALSFFKPSWAGKTAVALNGKSVESAEKDNFVSVNAALKAGDTLVYSFKQEPYLADTHNIHTIKGYQKVYQGPLVLGAMTKKETTLPKNAKLKWNAQTKEIKLGKLKLAPINDVIDVMYDRQTYKRQVLWKKN
ncbi:hypothetical protein PDESU_02071 [Pontiella desulfatans]|uniref:Non-reducing end beta-L-arabinofuranosidase n=2 Tax=Pontiella desulfatans TaxID=2750659 RepID=A0A6C2U1I0_PONDE|nr:hypothetical protein PDESU_02071 [Pontiella desulfatans]